MQTWVFYPPKQWQVGDPITACLQVELSCSPALESLLPAAHLGSPGWLLSKQHLRTNNKNTEEEALKWYRQNSSATEGGTEQFMLLPYSFTIYTFFEEWHLLTNRIQ